MKERRKMPILEYGDNRLRKNCAEITEWTEEMQRAAMEMTEYLLSNKDAGAVAANQWGCMHRFFCYKKADESIGIVINPTVLYGEKYKIDVEGCLSFPGVSAFVGRYEEMWVAYTEFPSLENIEEEVVGFSARVFQHEMEHLDGNLFIDNLTRKARDELLGRYGAFVLDRRAAKNKSRQRNTRR